MTTEPSRLLGKRVIVQNPHDPSSRWEGVAIAVSGRPSVLVEADGDRYMLPLEWARDAEEGES